MKRIITVEFEYAGAPHDDSWVEPELANRFSAIKDVRVIGIRPSEKTVRAFRAPSIFA